MSNDNQVARLPEKKGEVSTSTKKFPIFIKNWWQKNKENIKKITFSLLKELKDLFIEEIKDFFIGEIINHIISFLPTLIEHLSKILEWIEPFF